MDIRGDVDKSSLGASIGQRIAEALRPVRALKTAYVPLLLVYFAYGALGLIACPAICGSRNG